MGALEWALAGMVVACGTPRVVEPGLDDALIDRIWVSQSRGDFPGAAVLIGQLEDEDSRERARLDEQRLVLGRAHSLIDARAQGSWLEARYLSSREQAMRRLARARDEGVPLSGALLLEEARSSFSGERRVSLARAAMAYAPGVGEAAAVLADSLMAEQDYLRAAEVLDEAADLGRTRLVRRHLQARTGQRRQAAEGVLADIRADLAVPQSLTLLAQLLDEQPLADVEIEARRLLANDDFPGQGYDRARRLLLARLLADSGRRAEAVATLESLAARAPEEERVLRRWQLQSVLQLPGAAALPGSAAVAPLAGTWEERVDGDPGRTAEAALATLRVAREWSLAARRSYRDFTKGESADDLDGFLAALDRAAATTGDAPALMSLPRDDMGMFGVLLDAGSLDATLPGLFVLGGKGPFRPAELTVYDLLSAREVELDEPADASYRQCLVRRLRVPGYGASLGIDYAGVGLVHTVFLDLDQVELQARRGHGEESPPVEPLPANGTAERRAIDERLDVVVRLRRAAATDTGASYEDAVLDALAIHEERHIIDAQRFLQAGVFGRFADIVRGGVFPSSIWAEVERRAQLEALRRAPDPRIPLADAISMVPAEGPLGDNVHAVGYEQLVRDFLDVLDDESWDGAVPLESLGLRRDRVLLQQLDRLPPDVVRAVAQSIPM